MLNPLFAIPFVLGSGIAAAIILLASHIGFLVPNILDVPFGIPIIVNAFMGWGINGVLVQLIIIAAGVVLYVPFVLMANKQKVETCYVCGIVNRLLSEKAI